MITNYFRPQTIDEALSLLSNPNLRPLGGGTVLTQSSEETYAVVDLQSLKLDTLLKSGEVLSIGATVSLQALADYPQIPSVLKTSLFHEAQLNLRNMKTVAGTLVTCDGRSPFVTALLALDARISVAGKNLSEYGLGNLLPLRQEILKGKLITKIEISLNGKLAFETVGRSPFDRPIVCVAVAQWRSGRTRLALGGWGNLPSVAFDGNDSLGLETAARNAAQDAGDEWASAEYRSNVAAILTKRCLEQLALVAG